MSRVCLGDLTLCSFNESDEEHQEYKDELISDKSVLKFLKTLKKELKKPTKNEGKFSFNTPYFVSLDDRYIGYVYVFKPEDKTVELKYAVDRTNRGYGYGEKILRETSSYLLRSFKEIEDVKLIILNSNVYSRNSALKAGFVQESSFSYCKHLIKK